MQDFRLRDDLQRAIVDGFALPLGFAPGEVQAPTPGYTVDYTPGEGDEPDTYSIYVVASHERILPLVDRLFEILPDQVYGIVEIGSRDAYRSLDVHMGREPVPQRWFVEAWKRYEPFLLEDGSIGCGANGEDPFVEVFVDPWKGISVHVPLLMREDVEQILIEFGLSEVGQTWPPMDDDALDNAFQIRGVLVEDDQAPGVDEILYQLRQMWRLELNIDPDSNVDDAGRDLGHTLWHAILVLDSLVDRSRGAYASVWATARSLTEMDEMIDEALASAPEWRLADVYTIDRVAHDERPEELGDLPPRRDRTELHLVSIDE